MHQHPSVSSTFPLRSRHPALFAALLALALLPACKRLKSELAVRSDPAGAPSDPAGGPGSEEDRGEMLREYIGGLRYICASGPYKVYDFLEDGTVKTLTEVSGEVKPGPEYQWGIRRARLVLFDRGRPYRTFSFAGRDPGLIAIRGDDGVTIRCDYSRSPALGTGRL